MSCTIRGWRDMEFPRFFVFSSARSGGGAGGLSRRRPAALGRSEFLAGSKSQPRGEVDGSRKPQR